MPNFADHTAAASGLAYLQSVQSWLPTELEIEVMANLRDRVTICTWIGNYIDLVNSRLQAYLTACHECFHPVDRPDIEIFAVPLPQFCGLDGLCNLDLSPTKIAIDVGRVPPSDWLSVVAHEYTHAQIGRPGHDLKFAAVLSHLCLGLDLPTPIDLSETALSRCPPYSSALDPLLFWRGGIAWE